MENINISTVNEQYKWDRKNKYPSVEVQLDMLYWDLKNGTSTWVDLISSIKEEIPKAE